MGRGRGLSPRTIAQRDAILAVLREQKGFPLSTGQIAEAIGGTKRYTHTETCHQCGTEHRCTSKAYPIGAQDLRGLLNRMARDGFIEKVILDGQRHHYWRL